MSSNHAGQIVRIHLENFMSHDNIEIYPGKSLNLIIGPNGTGKSSIVCAVLLGLGGNLKTLGRADQLSSYVKSGCDQCCIEIELYEPKGSNVIIKRKILNNNQSEFMVDGKVTTAAKIGKIVGKYNVQIDNLCTFLPQEKVQDFSKLNSQQLLDQTQKTIGQGSLVQLHEELKVLWSETVKQENKNKLIQNELENEIQKNERLKDKVQCFKEKQSLCEELVTLQQKKAWMEYSEEVKKLEVVLQDKKAAEKLYNNHEQEIIRFDKILEYYKKSLHTLQHKLKKLKKYEAVMQETMDKWLKRVEQQIGNLEDLKRNTQLKLYEEEEKKKEVVKYREKVDKLTNDLKTFDANFGSEAELRSKENNMDQRLKDTHLKETQLNQMKVDLQEEEDTLTQEILSTIKECDHLKKRKNARLEYLKKHEPDVYRSMEWLDKNRHLFRSRVYNPMLLELDVPDSKMAKYVEALLHYKDLISFTCTNADDLNLLIQKLRTEQKLKVNAVCSDENDTSQYIAETPINSLRSYGFFSYLKDLLTGPNDILRFLCKTYKIHCVPVGNENVKVNCENIPQNIRLFYSEDHVFSVKYSVYSGDKSITVKNLTEPYIFSESVDEGRIQILLDREKDLKNKISKKRREIEDVYDKIEKLRRTLEEVKKIKRELSTKVEERNLIKNNLNRAVDSYNSAKTSLRDPEEIYKEADEQREALKTEVQTSLEKLKKTSEDFLKIKRKRKECELRNKIKKCQMEKISEIKSPLIEVLKRQQEIIRGIEGCQKQTKLKCLQLKEAAKQLTKNIARGEKAFKKFEAKFEKLSNNPDELEAQIEETQAKMDFLHGGNYQTLQEFEKREKKIAELRESLGNGEKTLEERRLEILSKQDLWLNPVNELVSNINANFGKFFEAMGCAGEVSLVSGKNETDFEHYGIKILVKFRDGTPLQELSRYFQSGGERAVATAVFMLSLQELTSVPFRFVDEINQGMDLENEKRILQLMIQVTSEHSTQYFFITPKLLPNLECSKTMQVHCIYNGPNAIPATDWDIIKFLRKRTSSQIEDDDDSSS